MRTLQAILSTLVTYVVTILIVMAASTSGLYWNSIPLFGLFAVLAFVVQWVVFVPSFLLQTEHYFDLTGSLTYLGIVACAVFLTPNLDTRDILICVMIALWAIRLGSFLFWRVKKSGGDDRFVDLKPHFWVFFMVWNIQALWVFLTLASAMGAMTSSNKQALGIFALIGTIVWIVGFAFEVIADQQKTAFRALPENKDTFIQTGLWSICRHPNYFGEITLWLGIAIIAFPVLSGWTYATLISPVFVTILLTRISGIPMLAEKGKKKWGADPAYQEYLKNTPVLIPGIRL